MSKLVITLALTTLLSGSCLCKTVAYVPATDEGVVYRISLETGEVESKIAVGGRPYYASAYQNTLFLDGPKREGKGSYIQVFDLEGRRTLRQMSVGTLCCSLLTESEIVYAVSQPAPELLAISLSTLSARTIQLPEHFVPASLAAGENAGELLVLASEYAEPGVAKQTVCFVVSITAGKILRSFGLPLGADSILNVDGRMVVSTVGSTAASPFFYSRSIVSPKWVRFDVSHFCRQYTNRQLYLALGSLNQLIYSAGDCPGDAELEQTEPTILAIDPEGSLSWSVTEKADHIPSCNSIAALPDGRIAIVSRGWGVGIFDPKTRKLAAHIRVGDNSSLWGI